MEMRTGERQPLLANDRPSSEHSDDRADAEDAAILEAHGHETTKKAYDWPFWREVGFFIWAVIATATVIVLAVYAQHRQQTTHDGTPSEKPSSKRNLVFMVSDGMGPASLSMTRSFRQYAQGLPFDDVLNLDEHLIGSSRTRSSSSLITDSAAGATAFSCGRKSYNGAISVLPDFTPCGTVLEAAKKAGYMTGLVVTTDITDATPACFASHVYLRAQEDEIAQQEVGDGVLGRVVDLMLGGGRCHFLPNTTEGSCRMDDRDITKLAQDEYDFSYFDTRDGFDSLDGGKAVKLPLLGLFASHDIPFEIDRRNMADVYPSLDELTNVALNALTLATQNSDKGFFLMVEGSRIDHAGHFNDPAAQVHEVLAYDKAFASVLDFIDKSEVETVLVATSDHETGGLAVARQLHPTYPRYAWNPQELAKASHSTEYLTRELYAHIRSIGGMPNQTETLAPYVKELVVDGLGIADVSKEEVQSVLDNIGHALYIFSDMISRRAEIGWSTHGHSAVDVNIYGTPGTAALMGNHENTEVGRFLREYLAVDVDAVTRELSAKWKPRGAMAADLSPRPGDEDDDPARRRLLPRL